MVKKKKVSINCLWEQGFGTPESRVGLEEELDSFWLQITVHLNSFLYAENTGLFRALILRGMQNTTII